MRERYWSQLEQSDVSAAKHLAARLPSGGAESRRAAAASGSWTIVVEMKSFLF